MNSAETLIRATANRLKARLQTKIISSISKSEGIIEINEDLEYIKKGTLLKFYRYEDILN